MDFASDKSESLLDTLKIVIAHDSYLPFDVEAIALEEDTALITIAINSEKKHK